MSRHVIEFGGGRLELELSEEALVGAFQAPEGMTGAAAEAALRGALERPKGYPALRQIVVPGDRLAIAIGADVPDARLVLDVATEILEGAGVELEAITVVGPPGLSEALVPATRGGLSEIHDPACRDRLAYLATTAKGSRIYLNRTLTDSDVVLPVGLLRHDPLTGPQGPWSVLFPELSDEETREAHRRSLGEALPTASPHSVPDEEAVEVGTLLGAHLQIGVVPGSRGPVEYIAGLVSQVRDVGMLAIDRCWSFRPESRAELVVAGIGGSEGATSLHELVAGLATASRLVQRGGKIVALSRAAGPLGPSLQRLAAAGDGADAREVLRGCEADPDSLLGRTLARILAWADVYLLSRLDPDVVEDLSMVVLDRPEEARRLAERSSSCLVVDRADRVRVDWGGRDDA